MVTAQDIREKAFEKAFNGYNMGQVDEFLDEMAADVSAMTKEITTLKGKLRVLVEKVEEYRQTEDSMRLALLSAQKMSAQIEAEAREKADTTVAEAKDYANRITRQATDGIANEEAKLEEAKKATDRFFEHMKTVCEKQIEFYDKLSQMQLVGGEAKTEAKPDTEQRKAPATEKKPAPVAARETPMDETVRSIETAAVTAALDESSTMPVDTDLPEEEDEPTRLFPTEPQPKKKKRGFDDFRFDDDI